MIILVFASKWSLHCDFFLYSTVFVSVFFRREYHVLTTVIYKQISTIFQAIMYSLYKHISFFCLSNFLHIFGSISIKITNQISNLHSIRYTTLDLMVLEIREQLGTKVDVPQNLCSDVFSQEP